MGQRSATSRRPLHRSHRIGVVGCGAISGTYIRTLRRRPEVEVVGCADIDVGAARSVAQRHSIRCFSTPEELIESSSVDLVLNLTPPLAHERVSSAALEAGKHVYTEKPLAATFADGLGLTRAARAAARRIGAAPDTFLGAGWQTARRLLDNGTMGVPVAAEATFLCRGHERWHPRPAFYYARGGGPLLDMGPYYLTGLVAVLGPVRSVIGMAQISFPERRPVEGPNAGRTIPVAVPTHVAGLVEFVAGASVTLITSFDVWHPKAARVVLYGTDGTLELPDPNQFGGKLRFWSPSTRRWSPVPLDASSAPLQARGLGLLDLCEAIEVGRAHRASSELALHILETMHGLAESASTGARYVLSSSCERPAPYALST